MKLHPKVLELRNKVGYKPINLFVPSQKAWDAVPLETRNIRAADDSNERLIKQYFCIWGVKDDYGMKPIKGAFTKSLNERGPSTKSAYKIVVLNQHNQRDPLCIPNVLLEDEVGLYGEYEPDPMESGDRLVMQVRRGTIQNGSYGFNYVWDKMEYDESDDSIIAKEMDLYEVSPVTIGSQTGTFFVRNKDGVIEDPYLEEETEEAIKLLPRKHQLEIRSLITRHISLANSKPDELRRNPLEKRKPTKQSKKLDYSKLLKHLKDEENLF